jgi:PAS domain S-box-containing protein
MKDTPGREVSDAPSFLKGGGQAGKLLARLDWSSHPLGLPHTWPQSLRTTLSLCLASRQPICILWGPERTYFYNDAYAPILGSKHPALGRSYPAVWPEIWEEDIRPLLEPVEQGGQASWSDNLLLVLHRHGFLEECYFVFSFAPIRDESGQVGGVFTAVTETTRQLVQERRLRVLREVGVAASEARLAEEVGRRALRALGQNRHDAPFALLYLLDGEERATLVAGYGIDQIPSLAPPSVRLSDPSSSPWSLREALSSSSPSLQSGLMIRANLPPWYEPIERAFVLPLGQDHPLGLLVVGISPRRPLDEEYRGYLELGARTLAAGIECARACEEEHRRAEALAQLDRVKTAFFSNVSHEFRTPLTLILGPLEDGLRSGSLPSESIEVIHRNAQRLLKLVNTLLEFSRVQAGRAVASFAPTDLPALTAELASVFRSAVERAGLRYLVRCAPLPSGEPVYLDWEMWERILLNLLSNALKFTFEGEIEVAVEGRPDCVMVMVRDTGGGIPEEELPRLFERFHRPANVRSRTPSGSGIGLALVQELVALHGGTLQVSSRPGVGTTFTITLRRGSAHIPPENICEPRGHAITSSATAYVEEALRWLPAAEPPDGPSPTSGWRPRILVVDDNPDLRDYVSRILSRHWEVYAVEDGHQALHAAKTQSFDLVLTDVMMPGMDGFELMHELKRDVHTRSLPVLMLSARAGEESLLDGLEAGADDYLVKPFSARELVARVATHLELTRLRSATAAESIRLRAMFEQAPAGVAVLNGPDHRYEVANPLFLAITHRVDIVGKTHAEAFPELDSSELPAVLDRVYETGEPFVAREYRVMLDRNGTGKLEESFFRFHITPIRDLLGDTTGLMIVAVDVTEQVRASQEVARARAEAERANRAKDEFLAMLGHELRNPLAPILTALHLMKLRGDGQVERERTIIERQVKHVVRLVDDLLDVSRVTSGKIELRMQRVDIGDVVGRAIEIASPLFEQNRQRLTVDVPKGGLRVRGDPGRLAQVVANLLNNAAKYTEEGGRVSVSARLEEDWVVIDVQDDGIGMAKDMISKVFDLFTQERQALDRSRGGLGLGLAIVRSMVALHGGTVHAHSEGPGRGSTFSIRLPALQQFDEPPTETGETRLSRRPASAPPGRRVMVVDDNEDAAITMADMLRELGCATEIAHDGPRALQKLDEFGPRLVLVDIGLPVMDGYELARQLRQRDPDLLLIAVTGYGQDSDRRRSREAGFDDHLVKPVSLEEIREVLSKVPGLTT